MRQQINYYIISQKICTQEGGQGVDLGPLNSSRLIHWWGHLHLRFVPPVGHKSSPQLGSVGSATHKTLWEAARDL